MCVFCKIASGELPSKRKEIKDLIKHLRTVYSDVDKCIFRSAENINLSSVLGWNDDEKSYILVRGEYYIG